MAQILPPKFWIEGLKISEEAELTLRGWLK